MEVTADSRHAWEEFSHNVGLPMNNHPARVAGVVLGNISTGELAFTHGWGAKGKGGG